MKATFWTYLFISLLTACFFRCKAEPTFIADISSEQPRNYIDGNPAPRYSFAVVNGRTLKEGWNLVVTRAAINGEFEFDVCENVGTAIVAFQFSSSLPGRKEGKYTISTIPGQLSGYHNILMEWCKNEFGQWVLYSAAIDFAGGKLRYNSYIP